MEITLSKASIRTVLIAVFVLLLGFGGYYIWANNSFVKWFSPQTQSVDFQSQPAITALVDLYSPDHTGDRTAWEDKVCANMTQEGCLLFRRMYASTIWSASPQGSVTAAFSKVVDNLGGSAQIWEAKLTMNNVTSTVYIQTEKTTTGRWLLARVMFDEEVEKYQQ